MRKAETYRGARRNAARTARRADRRAGKLRGGIAAWAGIQPTLRYVHAPVRLNARVRAKEETTCAAA